MLFRSAVVRKVPKAAAPQKAAPGKVASDKDVRERVLPEIPGTALASIHGKVSVIVRVTVEPSGAVSSARLEQPLASKYLSGFVVDAARKWTFARQTSPRDWLLRFELRPETTDVVAKPLRSP